MSNLKMKIQNETYKVDMVNKVVIFSGDFEFAISGTVVFSVSQRGKARCSEDDTFNSQFGMKLARNKAVIKARTKFENLAKRQLESLDYAREIWLQTKADNAVEFIKDSEKLNKLVESELS